MKAKKADPGLIIHKDLRDTLRKLRPEEIGSFMIGAFDYFDKNEDPDFCGDEKLDILWTMVKNRIDDDLESYKKKCEVNAQNCRLRGTRPYGAFNNIRLTDSQAEELKHIVNEDEFSSAVERASEWKNGKEHYEGNDFDLVRKILVQDSGERNKTATQERKPKKSAFAPTDLDDNGEPLPF